MFLCVSFFFLLFVCLLCVFSWELGGGSYRAERLHASLHPCQRAGTWTRIDFPLPKAHGREKKGARRQLTPAAAQREPSTCGIVLPFKAVTGTPFAIWQGAKRLQRINHKSRACRPI